MAKAGRKSKAEEMGLQKLLNRYVSNAARAKVIKRLLVLSNNTKEPRTALEAIKLLMAYLYGTPKQSMELIGNKDKPLEIVYVNNWRERDTPAGAAPGAAGGVAIESALQVAVGGETLAEDDGWAASGHRGSLAGPTDIVGRTDD